MILVMKMLSKSNHSQKLSPSEEYLWKYIQNHRHSAMAWSITELSEHANVSTATIVRAMKKKGYNGYTDFRYGQLKSDSDTVHYSILNHAGAEISNIVMQNEYEMTNTLKNLDVSVIEDTIQLIKNANMIYIFARGLSESIAEEMELKLQLLDKHVAYFHDPNFIVQVASKIDPGVVVIFISLNGETKELITAAKLLSENDIPQILLTANANGSMSKYADEIFLGYRTYNNFFAEYEVYSRLPLQIMSRILLDSYVVRYQREYKQNGLL